MGIKKKGSYHKFNLTMKNFIDRVEDAIFLRFSRVGEEAVIHAKSIPGSIGFMDQTGNLRSSIGYTIYLNGMRKTARFEGTGVGTIQGQSIADEIAKSYPTGWVLVVVAGMNYAVDVEARGRDVLTSAEQLAWQRLPAELKELKDNIKSMSV